MRVGRAAIDEEAIRLIEEHNPDVDFDWTRILKFPASADGARQPAPRAAKHEQKPRPEAAEQRRPVLETPAPERPEAPESATSEESAALAALETDDDAAPAAEPRSSVAEERLGSEGLLRLRARYAEIMARISERELDDSTRDELKALAERLNPDAWVTEDEVRAGLDSYESVLATLRPQVGAPRRRRRRGSHS